MSKFHDAIKYGLKISNKLLSVEFYSKVDTFLFCYKKEFAEAKKKVIQMKKRLMPSTVPSSSCFYNGPSRRVICLFGALLC